MDMLCAVEPHSAVSVSLCRDAVYTALFFWTVVLFLIRNGRVIQKIEEWSSGGFQRLDCNFLNL